MRSFNERWFNTRFPTLRTRVGMIGLIVVFVAFLAGVWFDFVTQPDLYYPLVLLACPAAAIAHVLLIRSGAKAEGRTLPNPDPARLGLLLVAAVVMLGFMYIPVLTKTVPYLVTQATGEQYEQDFRMWTDWGGRRSALNKCRYRLTGSPMGEIFSSYLCISEEAYHRYPDQQVTVSLIGRRGPLGMTIDRIQSLEPVPSP